MGDEQPGDGSAQWPPLPPYAAPPDWQPPPPPYGMPDPGRASGWHSVGGYPQPRGYAAPGTTNGFAIAALVCAIVGLVFPVLPGVLGIVFGRVALGQIKRTGDRGHGLAVAGIVVGIVSTLLSIAFLVYLAAHGSSASSPGGGSVSI